MFIGEILAQSRQRAGLSVARVSEQTRIRERIIRGVEDDDYSACGGDFYARGHIRAIATAVGTDPGPLIREYDRVHRAPGAVWTVSLEELLATSAHSAQRRRPDLPAVGALVVSAYASARRRVKLPAVRELAARAPQGPGRRVNRAVVLGLALAVVLGFGIYRVLSGSPRAAVASAGGREPCGGRAMRRPGTMRRPGPLARPSAGHAGSGAEDRLCSRGTGHSTGHASAGADPSCPRRSGWPGRAGAIPSSAGPVISGHSPGRRLAHRRLRHRPLREPVPGHAPALGHGLDGRGHQQGHQPRQGFRHRFPAAGRHQDPHWRTRRPSRGRPAVKT